MSSTPDLSLPTQAPPSISQYKDSTFEVSAFPLYSLVDIAESEISEIAAAINDAARDFLGFGPEELDELGRVVEPAPRWAWAGKALGEVLEFHASGGGDDGKLEFTAAEGKLDPKWCPLAFVVVISPSWREEGLLLVGFEFDDDGDAKVASCRAKCDKLGEGLVSLRQGDEGFAETRQYVAMEQDAK